MGAAPASPEGLKSRRTVAEQVAPEKTGLPGMPKKFRQTPATAFAALFLPLPEQMNFENRYSQSLRHARGAVSLRI